MVICIHDAVSTLVLQHLSQLQVQRSTLQIALFSTSSTSGIYLGWNLSLDYGLFRAVLPFLHLERFEMISRRQELESAFSGRVQKDCRETAPWCGKIF